MDFQLDFNGRKGRPLRRRSRSPLPLSFLVQLEREEAGEVEEPLTGAEADKWEWVKIGEPLPENPVRVQGHQNQYVALCYKDGKPIFGRAWNNGGVVECSFPYNGKELTTAASIGGQIQVLTYKGDIRTNQFEYKWVPFFASEGATRVAVRCAQATPMLLSNKAGSSLVGNLDLTAEIATVAEGGVEEKLAGLPLKDSLVIVREHFKPKTRPINRENLWRDIRTHDPVPCHSLLIKAGNKTIKTEDGRLMEHFVALWYKNGEPVFGRCWGYKGDKIEASFGIFGKEFTGAIGSIQVLTFDAKTYDNKFAYKWVPYAECMGGAKEWKPIQVNDAAPVLIKDDKGHEKLGCCWMNQGKASTGAGGVEETYVGDCVMSFLILCRKDLP